MAPTRLIRPDWVCYCVGVGLNATFDVALAGEFGCRVYSFDPTPTSIQYMSKLAYDHDKLTFVPVGVWSEEKTLRLFAPANPAHQNHSAIDLHGTGDFFEAECFRLSTLMKRFGQARIDLLKIDIEGAWEPVLDNLIAERLPVGVLCVEFDSPTSLRRIRRMVRKLDEAGMALVWFEKENYVFVDRDMIPA